jgi:hypothetical protein
VAPEDVFVAPGSVFVASLRRQCLSARTCYQWLALRVGPGRSRLIRLEIQSH